MPTTIEGRIAKIRFSENNFLIANLDGGQTIKGPMLEPQIGMGYIFTGDWEEHPKWGKQFAFTAFSSALPTDSQAVREYLAENCDGVGPAIGKAIVETYGEDALKICKEDPGRVASEIKGITAEAANRISEKLLSNEAEEELQLGLKTLFANVRIGRWTINQIIAKYRHEAPQVVKCNPYRLMDEIAGIGFLTADRVALDVGFEKDDPRRLRAGIIHTVGLASAGGGHTYVKRSQLRSETSELLDVPEQTIEDAIRAEEGGDALVVTSERVSGFKIDRAEHKVAGAIAAMMTFRVNPTKTEVSEEILGDAAEDQRQAIVAALQSPVFVLTGAPGTGKTWTINKIVQAATYKNFALAAPTGKAARRISEQSGYEAVTIHRLLEPLPTKGGGFKFTRNAVNPIQADFVILDEASMIDVNLMSAFLAALRPKSRLVIVGDTNQLASVGPGNVLKDIIASGLIPTVELTEIKRQNPGLLVTNIHRVKDGGDIEVENDAKSDFFFTESDDEAQIRDLILDLVTRRIPERYSVHPVKEIQVITPLREKTLLGCKEMNKVLQARLNDAPAVDKCKFRMGDKVVQLSNDYALGIVNGDIGYIIGIERPQKNRKITVRFENPERVVKVPFAQNDLDLAYCLTCHKFQGSEAPVVVIPAHRCFGNRIFQRNWFYTALSRARDLCVVVGSRVEIRKAIGRTSAQKRDTLLAEFLVESCQKTGHLQSLSTQEKSAPTNSPTQ